MPIDLLQQTVVHHVGHTEPDAVAITVVAEIADENPLDARLAGPGIRIAEDAAIHNFGIHARPADVLADFIEDQNIQRHRYPAHPTLDQRQKLFFGTLHVLYWNSRQLP